MNAQPPLDRRAQERLRERKIMRAAIEELAQSDYGGLSVESVAARAGVNKTTVYRKWETKAELMRAALLSVVEMFQVPATSGNLRTDLLRVADIMREFTRSFEGQCLMRLRLLQHPEPELAEIAYSLNTKQLAELSALFRTAVARGELTRDVDVMLLLDMLWGAIHARIVMKNEPVSDALLEHIVDMLLAAARVPRKKPRVARKRR